ncbi:MAG: response regulator [Deltaproteobacteria bacterium]|nr:response regulator [Deltaproteobacteria bacterium]
MSAEIQRRSVAEFEEDFKALWFERLNHVLPIPALAGGAFVVSSAAYPVLTGVWVVLHVALNIIPSIKRLQSHPLVSSYHVRAVTNAVPLFGTAYFAGADAHAWLQGIPVAFGGTFLLSRRVGLYIRTTSFLALAAGALLGGASLREAGVGLLLLTILSYLVTEFFEPLKDGYVQAELQRQEIAEKNVQLTHALDARKAFLANMSHEIRTPLNGVLGMAELLEQTPLDPEQLDMVKVVRQAGQGLLVTINDILDLAKLEAGRVVLAEASFAPSHLAEQVLELLRVSVDPRRVKLSVDAEGMPARLTSDPMRLRQVLVNLVGNAVKFTEDGEIVVRLRHADGALSVEVRDTGIGIQPERAEALFLPFEQADASTSRRYGGTGLGLSISRRLVTLLGGELWVKSAPGEGSTFGFTIPAEVAPDAPSPETTDTDLSTDARILVVDDNALNLRVAQAMLTRLGCRVTSAESGQAALDAVAAANFDLILMDCQMPIMDGFEATARLRAQGLSVPILALTAAVTAEEQARCYAAGMNAVVAKPVSIPQLRDAFAQWLPA